MRMTRSHRDALLAHAREEAPNECCGYLRARDGRVEEVFRAENTRRSPYGYTLDSKSLFAANELDDEGFEVGVYHSHPRSPAEPSQTDINLATYPHWTYLIVSLDGGDPGKGASDEADGGHVRGWRIEDRRVQEEEIVVE